MQTPGHTQAFLKQNSSKYKGKLYCIALFMIIYIIMCVNQFYFLGHEAKSNVEQV